MAGSATVAGPSKADRILGEGPLSMAAAAKLLGSFRQGKATHPSTVSRWATAGVRTADGSVLRLEAIRLGGRLATSRAALVRFLDRQQDKPVADPAPPERSPHARSLASEAAERELQGMGC